MCRILFQIQGVKKSAYREYVILFARFDPGRKINRMGPKLSVLLICKIKKVYNNIFFYKKSVASE